MSQQESPLGIAAIFVLLVSLLTPTLLMGHESAAPQSEPIKVIVWGDGRWNYVEMIQEKYGSIIYQKPGGIPVAAKVDALDERTTLELKRAFETFFDACTGEPADLASLFELTGRSKQLFFTIAGKHSNACLQRLHQDYQRDLIADEQLPNERTISDVAGEITLKKSGGSSAVTISDDAVSRQLTIDEYVVAFSQAHEDFSRAMSAVFQAADRLYSPSDLLSEKWKSEMLGACDRVEKTAQPLRHLRPPPIFWDIHQDIMKGVSNWLNAVQRIRDSTTNLDPTGVADATRLINDAKKHWLSALAMMDERTAAMMSTARESAGISDDAIKTYCRDKWPDAYDRQASCVKDQTEGASEIARRTADDVGIPAETFGKIRAACIDRWHDDYHMRNYCEEQQLAGFKELRR